ncbi:MAG: hypothetical protein HY819_04840 [Acidobacteria bacterium]|nr:hypothetical protein [Acidobacteriota bacterium]
MRCETVVENFQFYLFKNSQNINLVPHLENCEYCRKDCKALLDKHPEKIRNQAGLEWQKIRLAIYQIKISQRNDYNFTLLDSRPTLAKCFDEVNLAAKDFIVNPKAFILEVIREFWQTEDRPYWNKSWRVSTAIWLCSFISLASYGMYGISWFADDQYSYSSKAEADEYTITYINPVTNLSPKWLPEYTSKDTLSKKQKSKINSNSHFVKNSLEIAAQKPFLSQTNILNNSFLRKDEMEDKGISNKDKISTVRNFALAKDIEDVSGKLIKGSVMAAPEAKPVSSGTLSGIVKINDKTLYDDDDYDEDDDDEEPITSSSSFYFGSEASSNTVPSVIFGVLDSSTNADSSISINNSSASFSVFNDSSGTNTTRNNAIAFDVGKQDLEILPITVVSKVLNPNLQTGQIGLVGVIFDSNNVFLKEASFDIYFDTNVVKIKTITDGGMMSLGGQQAQLKYSVNAMGAKVTITRSEKASAVSAQGQLALVYFETIGKGKANIELKHIVVRDATNELYWVKEMFSEDINVFSDGINVEE